jgi:hypothetical protein
MSSATDVLVPEEVRHDREEQRKEAERQARPELENQRKEAEQQAARTLDPEAIAVVDETERALNAISLNKKDEAIAAIERAIGKINILLARNPNNALIPVNFAVDIIDTAPDDPDDVRDIAEDVSWAIDEQDYPSARVLLHALMSEIRVRAFNLPLETYPDVLAHAARLLGENKTRDANNVLLTALNTLVAIDYVTPIPLLLARAAVDEAQRLANSDKNAAQSQLEMAENQLQRCKDLGYAARDPEYLVLRDSISELRKQLKRNEDTGSAFKKITEKLAGILKRQSDRQQSQPQASLHRSEGEAKRKDSTLTSQDSTRPKKRAS